MPIADYVVYTAESDPNELLGRPGGYSSKVNFSDQRLESGSDFDIDDGGSVEVFGSSAHARARYEYVDALSTNASFASEYHWLSGAAFLRVSRSLTPEQAGEYEHAFARVLERLAANETFPPLTIPTVPPVANTAPADPAASPFVGVGGVVKIPEGFDGQLQVVMVGTYDGLRLPVVVRNRTPEAVLRIAVSATVRDASGEIITTGSDFGLEPNVVQSGEIAFGYVYFGGDNLPAEATYDFVVQSEPIDGQFADFENIRNLAIETHRLTSTHVVGEARNTHPDHVTGPNEASVMCFDGQSQLVGTFSDFTDQESVDSGGVLPFSVDVRGECQAYLVAVAGFSD